MDAQTGKRATLSELHSEIETLKQYNPQITWLHWRDGAGNWQVHAFERDGLRYAPVSVCGQHRPPGWQYSFGVGGRCTACSAALIAAGLSK